MLGQQLPCSITVPAEGRDLGRSQWHFPSHQRLPSPARLLLSLEPLLSSCALQSGKQSCDRDTRVRTNPASTPEAIGKQWKNTPKQMLVSPRKCSQSPCRQHWLVWWEDTGLLARVTSAQESLQDQTSPGSGPKLLPLPSYWRIQ